MWRMMFPLVTFDRIEEQTANGYLILWEHKMGPLRRPFPSETYALRHNDEPVCVTAHSCLVRNNAAGLPELTRENTIELSRLCAARPHLCRVGIRLWREFVFPTLGYAHAISYQDADMHNGNTYRFDGWERHPVISRSGTDQRSGRKGRNKYIWIWHGKS